VAYPTDAQLKTWLGISGAGDDAQVTFVNTAAKGFVERYCNRIFEGASSVKNFPVRRPYVSRNGLRLSLFQDAAAVTAVTNGDGVAFTVATELLLHPIDPPYYEIHVKPTSGKVFYSANDTPIAVTATWGFATTCPPAIFEAILEIGVILYRGRESGGSVGQVGRSGVFIQGVEIPKLIVDVLDEYKRVTA
jgi:hypothetical protein